MKIHAIQTEPSRSRPPGAKARPRPSPPTEHNPRPKVDGAAADLRVRNRALGRGDRRRHGRDARASQPGYFPGWHPGVRAFREWVEPDQEMARSLTARHSPERCALASHDPSAHRPRRRPAPLPRDRDSRHAQRTRVRVRSAGRLRGYVANTHWPTWFRPTLLELAPAPFGPFPQSLRLTEAGDVTLEPVPGHTPGQIGVLIEESDHTVFLAGDSSYTQDPDAARQG